MSLNLQKFSLTILACFVAIISVLYLYYFKTQQEKAAQIIINTLRSELAESNYIISNGLQSEEMVLRYQSLIERIAANNPFISVVLIHNDSKVLISTNPFVKEILPVSSIDKNKSLYDQITSETVFEDSIRYYKDGKLYFLKMMFIVDHNEIKQFFNQEVGDLLIFFVLIPSFLIFLIWLIIRKLLLKPLEHLRQFAYYHDKVPKAYAIRELETIRYSMVQTFDRLEEEKKELYNMARKDSLSGLSNRNALMEHLQRLINICKRHKKEFALLFLDLDHFKSVNDSLGHNVGDALLKEVSFTLSKELRPEDYVARVGGDEFVIVLQEYESLFELTKIVDRIQSVIEKTWLIHANPINISSSIGIAFYPKDGGDIVSLMKNSDIAMYEAKNSGRAKYHFFTEELNQKVQESIIIEKEMRIALENNEFELYYQPKLETSSQKVLGLEALIRWNHPKKGVIPPDKFIGIAEEKGLIVQLGEWIYKQAILDQVQLIKSGFNIKISINLSPQQLLQERFVEHFIDCIEVKNINPNCFDVEITENLFYSNSKKNIAVLSTLQSYGITISLDDFGTGYSSLSYLKAFPIDYIKIDKTFLDDFHEKRGQVFIETIVNMAKTLDIKTIAEGVETDIQLKYLQTIECDQFQGYLYSKPLPLNELKGLLTKESQTKSKISQLNC